LSDPKELVSVYQGANATEAHVVMNLLLDEGIEAFVSEENEPFAGLPIAAPDVLVKRSDEVHARSIIERYDNEQLQRAARPDWKCPKCSATVIGALDECDRCGAIRPGSEDEFDYGDDEDEEEGPG
jgi:hypothetical protein